MSVVARSLVRLYPDAFRERWGAMVEEEARGAGWKSWPNLIAGIADMWLHPALWPADSPAQRQRRVATMGITVALAAWLLSHLVAEQGGPLPAYGVRSGIMHGCTTLLLLGIALVAPRPRPSLGAAITLLRWAVRRLAAPTVLGTSMVVVVHGGVDAAASPPTLRTAVVAGWWIALGLGAIQIPRIFTGVGADAVVPPHPGRLRLGVWTLAAASATGGATILGVSVAGGGFHLLAATVGVALLLLTAVCAGTLRDLRDLTSAR
ncbi:hypothetical protein P3T36_003948 [Kitasatospora sp. MAP12-15]|uniref:hypothetical protein n=1 Tax=unclassified Kitasatospora TaxID=2633591 RepID=UPI0024737D6D|nr:hypothetical protein [Kitasatospora sp. MAP12-44]MDH6108408.1 hypothetical protein [Kitasatospora sp. MAP12-44]